ncbi:Spx/MgsR family RNA polymerase-binding regulatory protein [Allopusillimonas soli]|uniref:Spx/MgsR family RNA polymerase-binding regulatory protein n=1 Tax=Allopusillimonas soli TaxID=659016 RepID=A0A853FFK5_9BURK|nr:Spx/MgsR family RNA polymerase-binding regulatory protein [Allopusillimonas soli]NYT38462.1 Spx/MgsR family RNA polymerase-binding regulatory protein [Allopusillimonas soli]TEA71983.1 Spx/MgsR family RNA polymerase-binding regulatory protein [Allopusillimonas soli]
MSTLVLYGLKKCSTCIKAMQWLDEHKVGYDFVDYRESPVDPNVLRDWAEQLGGWEKLVNRASMTWRNLPQARKNPGTDAQWLALIAEYPALVRRPVAVDAQGEAGVGFSDKKYTERFR